MMRRGPAVTLCACCAAVAMVVSGAGWAAATPASHAAQRTVGTEPVLTSQSDPDSSRWNLNGANNIDVGYDGTSFVYSVTFTQTGSSLTGTLDDPYYTTSGPVSGTINGDSITLTFSYPSGSVQGTRTYTGTISQSGAVSGTWTQTGDESPDNGTWTLENNAVPSPSPSPTFTVTGSLPVKTAKEGNESQYTADFHPNVPDGVCDPFFQDQAEKRVALAAQAFANAGLPVSAMLLKHFLAGTGIAVPFPPGSQIADDLLENSAFQALNQKVQDKIRMELDGGATTITLAKPTLSRINLDSPLQPELVGGFRGTQGVQVNGSGSLADGSYTGTLTYVIEDSYGFTLADELLGFGDAARYLQVTCGAHQHPGGARWFPDSITVTVRFTLPAAP